MRLKGTTMFAAGFTLLEILIALLLISCFLLGFDATQLVALKEAKAAYYFSVATQQLENMTQQIRCSPKDYEEMLVAWNQQNALFLPNGQGMVDGEYPHFSLWLSWGKSIDKCEKNQIGQSGCVTTSFDL